MTRSSKRERTPFSNLKSKCLQAFANAPNVLFDMVPGKQKLTNSWKLMAGVPLFQSALWGGCVSFRFLATLWTPGANTQTQRDQQWHLGPFRWKFLVSESHHPKQTQNASRSITWNKYSTSNLRTGFVLLVVGQPQHRPMSWLHLYRTCTSCFMFFLPFFLRWVAWCCTTLCLERPKWDEHRKTWKALFNI